MNNVIVVLSNEEMTKINFVDLEKLYNFVVEKFFIWIHLVPQNCFEKMICRGEKNAHGEMALCRVQKNTLGKNAFCRVPKNGTRQNTSLPSARKKHSAKTHFAECRKMTLDKIHLCRVPKKTLGKAIFIECFFLPSIFYLALNKDRLCRVPDKIHSAKPPALGKVPVFGSDSL